MKTEAEKVLVEDDFLSVDEMLSSADVEYASVPAWNKSDGTPGNVRIGSLTAGDMIDFVQANEGPAKATAGIRLIIKSLVDKNGVRVGDIKQMDAFKKKNSKITNSVVEAILKLNGLDKKVQETAKNA
jgi:hypothetical protein